MRNFLLLTLVFITFTGVAQNKFEAGLTAGFVTSQIHGDGYAGFNKAGFKAGAFVETKIGEELIAGFEMIYITKGSKNSRTGEGIYLNYFEVPINIKYPYGKLIYEGGLSFGKLVAPKNFTKKRIAANYWDYEVGINIGINYLLNEKLMGNIRASNSLLPIGQGDFNILIAFGLNYKIMSGNE